MLIAAFTSPASLSLVVSYETVNTIIVKAVERSNKKALCWIKSVGTDEYEERVRYVCLNLEVTRKLEGQNTGQEY
jgi:hypothetical protein